MALKTTTLEQSGPRGYKLQLILNEESISIANNTSSMSYTLRLVSTTYNFSGFAIGWSVTVNGVVVTSKARSSASQRSISKNSTLDIVTGTIPSDTVAAIEHNSDGTKTITAYASIDMGTTTSGGDVIAPGPISISEGSMVLTAIPRASTFTVSNSNRTLEVGQTITIKPYISTYTHTVKYSCGSATGTIASGIHGATTGFTQSWTPTIATFAPQNKTGTSVNITISVETFNGNTSVGTNSTTVSFAIPASVKPTISSISTSCPQGHVNTYGGYVQGKSTCAVTVNASGSNGSTITGYSVTVGTAQSFTSSSFTTGVLTEASNALAISATVTDSRNRTATSTVTIKVYEYSSPKITKISLKRTNSSGTATESGTYGTVTFTATVSPLGNHNTATYTLKYKASSAGSYSSSTLSNYNNNYSVSNGTGRFDNASVSSAYSAYITVEDAFGIAVNSATDTMPSASAYFKADPENNAFSFGKLETEANTLMSAWPFKTSYQNSVAMGSYQSTQTTVENFVNEVRYSSGAMGSVNIGTAYTNNGITISTGWYNFIYSPHRSGGVSGAASGDNHKYGTLILTSMTASNGKYIIRVTSESIAEVLRIGYVYPVGSNPSSYTVSYMPFVSSTDSDQKLLVNNGVRYATRQGTASDDGYGSIILGNDIGSGTVGNKEGILRLYSDSTGYVNLRPESGSTGIHNIRIPNINGTMALEQTPTKSTGMTNNDTTHYRLNGTNGTNYFYVTYGSMVFITFNVYCVSAAQWPSERSFKGLPAPLLNGADAVFVTLADQAVGGNGMIAAVQSDGTVQCSGGTTGHYYYGTGVYIKA